MNISLIQSSSCRGADTRASSLPRRRHYALRSRKGIQKEASRQGCNTPLPGCFFKAIPRNTLLKSCGASVPPSLRGIASNQSLHSALPAPLCGTAHCQRRAGRRQHHRHNRAYRRAATRLPCFRLGSAGASVVEGSVVVSVSAPVPVSVPGSAVRSSVSPDAL